jgi:4-hydroxybenzoate polyprenyltransferase
MNRKTDEKEDEINHHDRYQFTKRYEGLLANSALAAYVLALLIAGTYGIAAVCVTAFPLVAGVLYSVPLLPRRIFRYRRLKEYLGIKNLIVAIAWAVLPTLLPISSAGTNPTAVTLAVGAFFFSLAFINSVIFDMRDIEGDTASGVMTIPVRLGVRRTKILLSGMNLVFGMMIVVLSAGAIPWLEFCLIVGGIVYAQMYILSFNPSVLANVVCDVVADGQFILFGGVLYLVTHVPI